MPDDLGLRPERLIGDEDGDSFVTLLCRDRFDRRVVLKCVRRGTSDAYRRLRNEALLVKHLRVRHPLRLLPYRSHGGGYLVTEFDPGVLLRPDRIDTTTVATIADALTEFQAAPLDLRQLGIVEREHLATYYVKVLVKNLLHLCPAHLSARDAAACLAILTAALPAIARQRVICHGDLLPTNLLYHHDDESVTFTDLEGFMGANHPLFDVLAFLSISGLDLMAWDWQRRFLVRYLSRAGALGLDASSREYQDAYRGILVFFLVYRLNEQRINESGGAYFDNVGPRRFVTRKAARLAAGRRDAWRDDSMDEALNVRKRNLRRALSRRLYREHVDAMASAAAAID